MKNITCVGLLIVTLISCSIGKQGVFYSEMTKRPTVHVGDKMIIVNTDNSNKNSALLIYKLDYSIDTVEKTIDLRAFQAVNKDYKNTFEIQINGLTKLELEKYKYYWIDPDNNKTEIDKIE